MSRGRPQALLAALEVADKLFPTYIDELTDDERDCFAELKRRQQAGQPE